MRVWIAFMVKAHGDDWEIINVYSEKEIAIERLVELGGELFNESTEGPVIRFFEGYYV